MRVANCATRGSWELNKEMERLVLEIDHYQSEGIFHNSSHFKVKYMCIKVYKYVYIHVHIYTWVYIYMCVYIFIFYFFFLSFFLWWQTLTFNHVMFTYPRPTTCFLSAPYSVLFRWWKSFHRTLHWYKWWIRNISLRIDFCLSWGEKTWRIVRFALFYDV